VSQTREAGPTTAKLKAKLLGDKKFIFRDKDTTGAECLFRHQLSLSRMFVDTGTETVQCTPSEFTA
jgi:hypothetical protein